MPKRVIPIEPGRLIVFREKHGKRYFAAFDEPMLHKVALKMLKERFHEGYIDDPGPLEKYHGCEKPYEPTGAEIEALPEQLQAAAKATRRRYRERRATWQDEHERYVQALKALRDNDGTVAFEVLQERQDYEYEGYTFEYLEEV